jgi:hypothetical protein
MTFSIADQAGAGVEIKVCPLDRCSVEKDCEPSPQFTCVSCLDCPVEDGRPGWIPPSQMIRLSKQSDPLCIFTNYSFLNWASPCIGTKVSVDCSGHIPAQFATIIRETCHRRARQATSCACRQKETLVSSIFLSNGESIDWNTIVPTKSTIFRVRTARRMSDMLGESTMNSLHHKEEHHLRRKIKRAACLRQLV